MIQFFLFFQTEYIDFGPIADRLMAYDIRDWKTDNTYVSSGNQNIKEFKSTSSVAARKSGSKKPKRSTMMTDDNDNDDTSTVLSFQTDIASSSKLRELGRDRKTQKSQRANSREAKGEGKAEGEDEDDNNNESLVKKFQQISMKDSSSGLNSKDSLNLLNSLNPDEDRLELLRKRITINKIIPVLQDSQHLLSFDDEQDPEGPEGPDGGADESDAFGSEDKKLSSLPVFKNKQPVKPNGSDKSGKADKILDNNNDEDNDEYVDWDDKKLITDELLERLLGDFLKLYTVSPSMGKNLKLLNQHMYRLWNIKESDLETVNPMIMDHKLQGEWSKQKARVVQLFFYLRERDLAGTAKNEKAMRNTANIQKVITIIDCFYHQIRSRLQLLEHCRSGSKFEFRKHTSVTNVCVENSLIELSQYQRSILFMLKELQTGKFRRLGDSVYKEVLTKQGHSTHFWKEYMKIKDFIASSIPRETNFSTWASSTKAPGTLKSVLTYLIECKDSSFPQLESSRYYLSWKHGVYDIYNCVYYKYKDRNLPDFVVSCNKHNIDFEFDKYIEICKKAYEEDPENKAEIEQERLAAEKAKTSKEAKKVNSDKDSSLSSLINNAPLPPSKRPNDYEPIVIESKDGNVSDKADNKADKADKKGSQPRADASKDQKTSTKEFQSRRQKMHNSFGGPNHKYLKYWHKIPTPYFDSILEYQELPIDVQHIVYAQLGKLLYWINQIEEWQQMIFIKGVPGSGKSSLLQIIASLFRRKDIAHVASNIDEKFGLAQYTERFVFMCSEVKKKFGINQTVFQNMTEGEDISLNDKYKDAKEVIWKSPMIFAGNEVMGWIDFGGNLARRIMLVNMMKKVRRQDMDLKYKVFLNEIAALTFKWNCAYRMKAKECGQDSIWKHVPQYFMDTRKALTSQTNSLMAFLSESDRIRLQIDEKASSIYIARRAASTLGPQKDSKSQDEKGDPKDSKDAKDQKGQKDGQTGSADEEFFEKTESGQFIISEEEFLRLFAEFCDTNKYNATRWNSDFFQAVFDDSNINRIKSTCMYKGQKRAGTYLLGVAEVQYRRSHNNGTQFRL